jgi:hypothetical protein
MLSHLTKKIFCPILFLLFISVPLFAAKNDTANTIYNGPPQTTDTPPASVPGKTDASPQDPKGNTSNVSTSSPFNSFEFLLSLAVLFFGLVVVAFEVYLGQKGIITDEHIFKCIILTMVITGSIVLITAGYSNNQITPVVGILGSIAGYMLGKTTPDKNADKSSKQNSNKLQNENQNENK